MSETITLQVEDASLMNAYVATPEKAGKVPAVLVFQEAFGVNNHIKSVADRIAGEGYIAIAPELYHRTAPAGFVASYTDFAQVQPHLSAITAEGLENDIRAAYNWLIKNEVVDIDKIACIGFCLGGRVSFIANTFLPLAAAVSFYGGGIQNLLDRAPQLNAPHLFFWGGKDQHIKSEHIQAVKEAITKTGKPFINVEISYADHGFFCDERASYNADAASEAWELTKVFFKNKLQSSTI